MNKYTQYKANVCDETIVEMNIYDKHIRTIKVQKKKMTAVQKDKLMRLREKQRNSKMISKKQATNRLRKQIFI